MAPNPNPNPNLYKEKWGVWKLLNRLRRGTARSSNTLNKWGYLVASVYHECGDLQTTTHTCTLAPNVLLRTL